MKKYEFTGDTKSWHTITVKQIRALRDFGNVHTGDIGGWIECEENLSHYGECWIYPDGMVWRGGKVKDNAIIDDGNVFSGALIGGSVLVAEGVDISGDVVITGHFKIGFGTIEQR